jgi:hypothetical protein
VLDVIYDELVDPDDIHHVLSIVSYLI